MWDWPLDGEDPLEKAWQPTSVFLPGESYGQRNLHGVAKRQTQLKQLSTYTLTCWQGREISKPSFQTNAVTNLLEKQLCTGSRFLKKWKGTEKRAKSLTVQENEIGWGENGETSVTSFFFQKASDGLKAPEFSPPPPGVLHPRSAGAWGRGWYSPFHTPWWKCILIIHIQSEIVLQWWVVREAETVFAVGLFFISACVFVCSFGARVSVHVMSCYTVSCHWF